MNMYLKDWFVVKTAVVLFQPISMYIRRKRRAEKKSFINTFFVRNAAAIGRERKMGLKK